MPPAPLVYDYRDITEWQHSPIHRVVLHDTQSLDRFHLYHPLSDSSYELPATVRRDMHGCDRVVGWTFAATFRMLQNNVGDLLANLDAYRGRAFDAYFFLKPDASVSGRTVTIALRAPVGVSWRIASGPIGPVFELQLTKALTSLYQYAADGGNQTLWNEDQYLISDPNP
jgi:hypothetical protein